MSLKRTLPILLGLGLLSSCGSGLQESLAVTPANPVARVGETLTITAQPLEDLAAEPEWELQELHGGGFTQSRGYMVAYVAPPSAGTYHLIARAQRPDGSRVKQTITVRVLADPKLEPAHPVLAPGATLTFSCRMRGLPRQTVTWSVDEVEGGTISPEGLYQAPARPGTYHVTATSTVDPSVSVTVKVRVE